MDILGIPFLRQRVEAELPRADDGIAASAGVLVGQGLDASDPMERHCGSKNVPNLEIPKGSRRSTEGIRGI